jgi:hypothetical protein
VVIGDLDLTSISIAPHETYAIPAVDPDAVLPGPVAFEGFQSVAGEYGQISQRARRMDLDQLPLNNILDPAESF